MRFESWSVVITPIRGSLDGSTGLDKFCLRPMIKNVPITGE